MTALEHTKTASRARPSVRVLPTSPSVAAVTAIADSLAVATPTGTAASFISHEAAESFDRYFLYMLFNFNV